MKNNFKLSTLGQLGKVSMCKRVLKNQTSENGQIPFYKISTFGGKPSTYISNELFESFRDKYPYPKTGDILISAAGTIGKTVIFDGEPSYFQDSNIVWIANDEKRVLNKYLYYYYLTEPWIATSGSTIKRLYNDNIRNLNISYPDIRTQKQITKVLSDLDAKIEVNIKINQELEAMAKTLYDYWFVQFDFPMSKEYAASIGKPELVGKPYKASGGKMVFNKELKREIPEGWEVGTILNCADLLGGGTPKKEIPKYWNGKIPFFTPTDTENNVFCLKTILYTNELGISSSSTKLFDKGTILITARGTVGKINIAGKPMAMNQSCYALKPKINFSSEFIYFHTDQIVKYLKAKSSGSIFKAIVTNDFKFTPTIVPDIDIVKLYSKKTISMFERILNNKKQNQKLAELRDWLLPMLMNGQVRVARGYDEVDEELGMVAEGIGKYGEG